MVIEMGIETAAPVGEMPAKADNSIGITAPIWEGDTKATSSKIGITVAAAIAIMPAVGEGQTKANCKIGITTIAITTAIQVMAGRIVHNFHLVEIVEIRVTEKRIAGATWPEGQLTMAITMKGTIVSN
jgi:hypothetical protein